MGVCGACGLEHPRPGEKTCKYLKDAIQKCKDCGADESDWRLYLDTDGASRETEGKELKPPVGTLELPMTAEDMATELQKQRKEVLLLSKNFSSISLKLDRLLDHSLSGKPMPSPPVPGAGAGGVGSPPPVLGHHGPVPGAGAGGVGLPPPALSHPGPGLHSVSPADVAPTPLTSALQQLTSAIDPESARKSTGIYLKPEFYVQFKDNNVQVKDLDHKKMSFRGLIYGMCCVLKHLKSTGGDVDSYLEHLIFVSRTGQTELYQDVAFCDYNKFVTDKVIDGKSSSFIPNDSLGFSSHFHAATLNLDKQAELLAASQYNRGLGSGLRRGRRGRRGGMQRFHTNVGSEAPEDYPEENCFAWNYRKCLLQNCPKEHVCRICKQRHKAIGCPKDKAN